jgi:radical SAM protein with 4Fe4S-binding SPASM domain
MKAAYDYHQDMGFALFQRVIDEASAYGCPSMSPNNINEPLLARDLVERVEYASKKGFIDISMQTNALLLTERTSERLLDSGLTRLHVSLDALTEPTYDKIRRGSNFQKVMRNVDTFLELRARRGRKLPLLRVSLVRLTVNEHEIPAFVEYWRKRADYIAIQEFLSPFPGRPEFEPFFTESRTTLSDFRCPQPWQRVVVQGDGEVQPCCSFFSRELTMGNVKTTPLRDIWRSPAMDRLRELHRDGRYRDEPVCAKCVTNWIGKGRAAVDAS